MTPREIRVNSAQLYRLRDDVLSTPVAKVSAHLSDEEFVEYSLDLLPSERVAELDSHLASCEECNEKMIRLLDATESRLGEQRPHERLEAIPVTVRKDDENVDIIMLSFGLHGSKAAWSGGSHTKWSSAKTDLAGFLESGLDGSVTVFLSSRHHGDGTLIRLRAGDWERVVELKTLSYDPRQFEARVAISRDERAALAYDVPLIVQVVDDPK